MNIYFNTDSINKLYISYFISNISHSLSSFSLHKKEKSRRIFRLKILQNLITPSQVLLRFQRKIAHQRTKSKSSNEILKNISPRTISNLDLYSPPQEKLRVPKDQRIYEINRKTESRESWTQKLEACRSWRAGVCTQHACDIDRRTTFTKGECLSTLFSPFIRVRGQAFESRERYTAGV